MRAKEKNITHGGVHPTFLRTIEMILQGFVPLSYTLALWLVRDHLRHLLVMVHSQRLKKVRCITQQHWLGDSWIHSCFEYDTQSWIRFAGEHREGKPNE